MVLDMRDDRSEKVKYDYADYPIYIKKALLSTYSNFRAPIHWHDDMEFIYVVSGEMKYNINGETVILKRNEGIIINARQIHFGFSDNETECDFICILLHPLFLCANTAFEKEFILPVIYNENVTYIKLNPDVLWQNNILKMIQYMYEVKKEKLAPAKIQSAFLNIWILLCENIAIESHDKLQQNTDLSILKNMVGFIQQNYSKKVSLSDIAFSGAVGQSKCCKLFMKYFNLTPNIYLTQYRLNKSVELLKDKDKSITEIAEVIGFGGSSYYAETFRKWSGMSPTEYRKKF
ncbi:MAG: helix-turn-helix domain-containing protein [Monoglobus pectinilyticus]